MVLQELPVKKGALITGILCLMLAWASPLPAFSRHSFYGHMIMHMLVVAVAAPFIALGLAGSRFDPTSKYPRFFSPLTAAVGELIIVWGWHAPGPHHFARQTFTGLILEQGSFILAGVWIWISSFGGINFSNRSAGVVGLLVTSMHMTFLGALLSLSTRPLYSHHQSHGNLSVLEDQHLGGAIMLVVGGVSYLWGGLWLTMKILKERKGKWNETVA